MTPTTSEREAFEAWVRQRHGLSTEKWADSGKYKYGNTNRWWECWQAALTREQREGTQHPDDLAVDLFAVAMKAKLEFARNNRGRGGWQNKDECSADLLSKLLRGHVDKGDPTDVANFCCFLWNRGEGIQPQPEAQGAVVFADWLAREMPPGTVISSPAWWAPRILRAVARATPPAPVDVRVDASVREALALLERATYHDGRYGQMEHGNWQQEAQQLLPRLRALLDGQPAGVDGGTKP